MQGVGFRWFTRDAALAHHVAGWVRNRQDDTVEAELHGGDGDVQAVLDAMALGPRGARVDAVTCTELPVASAQGFEIRANA